MTPRYLVRTALCTVGRHKMRSCLTVLGVVIGVASVVAMVAVGQGATASVRQTIARMGTHQLHVRSGSASSSGVSWGAGSTPTLTVEDGEAIARECPSVRAVTPVVRHRSQIVVGERNWVPDSMEGVGAAFPEVLDWPAADGRWFTEQEVRAGAKVCLLGRSIVREMFPDRSPLGAIVRVGNVPMEVIGVPARRGSNAWGRDQDDTVIVPWTTLRMRIAAGSTRAIDRLAVAVVSADALPRAQGEIERLLRDRHRIREGETDDFHVRDLSEHTEAFTETSRVMSSLLLAIASISLLVGGIGIMNIMLVSVSERTREIGVRLAVGARGRDILGQFLVEAVVLSSLGGILGAALGAAASRVVSEVARWPTVISAESIVVAVVFSAFVGVAFGFYPAWRASRLDPIECLRHE